eukprot:640805-Rhodomonas_salina.1
MGRTVALATFPVVVVLVRRPGPQPGTAEGGGQCARCAEGDVCSAKTNARDRGAGTRCSGTLLLPKNAGLPCAAGERATVCT